MHKCSQGYVFVYPISNSDILNIYLIFGISNAFWTKDVKNGLYLPSSELYCKDMLSKCFVICLSNVWSIRFDKSDSKPSINGKEVLYIPQDNLK